MNGNNNNRNDATTPNGIDAAALEKRGCLEASVLSVYDLPYSDAVPRAVTLSACGLTVRSGPPLARHKDRNSFRFSTPPNNDANNGDNNTNTNNSGSDDVTKMVVPLRELYQSTLKIRVVYDDPAKYLDAELPLRELKIRQQTWLILNLSPPPSSEPAAAASGETAIQAASSVTEEDMSPKPTIRIRFQLSGPYRPEIAAVIGLAGGWFRVIDKIEGGISGSALARSLSHLEGKSFNRKVILVPLLPIAALLVAAFPFLAGILALAVPFLLPLAVIGVGILGAVLASGGVCYASTRTGRERVGTTMGPLLESLVVSRPGQSLFYDTGPRPTPVSVCRQVLPTTIWSKLWVSLIIDLIGSSSYLLPVVGEGFDFAWAPAQTILIMALYDATSPNLKYLSFTEEIMPFTDIVPSACLGWAWEFLPLMWRDHAEKNDIRVDPKVTRAVVELATTAARVAKNSGNGGGENMRTSLQRAMAAAVAAKNE